MMNGLDMVNNYTGIDFENGCVEILKRCGFEAVRTGNDDKGVDIKASITIGGNIKKYYIQCKYQNKTLSMHPVQEIFTGTLCRVSYSKQFCFRNMIPYSFDYLIYPYYPAYTMGCYQFVISGDNKKKL